MKNIIKQHFKEEGFLKASLIIMGILIVWFNVMGYNILFKDDPLFWIITPIAILFFFAEMSVLLWSSSILQNWRKTKRILKGSMFIVVPIFALLSFTGINSYLNSLATSDYVIATSKVKENDQNRQYISHRQSELQFLREQLSSLNSQKSTMELSLQKYTDRSADFRDKISKRKANEKRGQCDNYVDCKEAVDGFEKIISEISASKIPLNHDVFKLRGKIEKVDKEIDLIVSDISKRKETLLGSSISVSGVESEFEHKKKIYADIVTTVSGWFGLTVDNPFAAFVALISGIIYPIYFLINLYIGLSNSDSDDENNEIYELKHQQRKDKLSRKKSYYQLRSDIFTKMYRLLYLRVQFSRRKHKLAQEHAKLRFIQKSKSAIEAAKLKELEKQQKISVTASMLLKAIRYFRVWASNRKKTRNIKVETIKEVEVEIEVEVIKEVEVVKELEVIKEVEIIKVIEKEVKVEVPVYVDKIVEVPTEIPVYIDRIVKVPEEVIVIEKETVVNEVLIMVPENISASDLEVLLEEHRTGNLAKQNDFKQKTNFSSKIAS